MLTLPSVSIDFIKLLVGVKFNSGILTLNSGKANKGAAPLPGFICELAEPQQQTYFIVVPKESLSSGFLLEQALSLLSFSCPEHPPLIVGSCLPDAPLYFFSFQLQFRVFLLIHALSTAV